MKSAFVPLFNAALLTIVRFQTIQRLSEVIVDLQMKQSIFEESVSEMQSCVKEKADSLLKLS